MSSIDKLSEDLIKITEVIIILRMLYNNTGKCPECPECPECPKCPDCPECPECGVIAYASPDIVLNSSGNITYNSPDINISGNGSISVIELQ